MYKAGYHIISSLTSQLAQQNGYQLPERVLEFWGYPGVLKILSLPSTVKPEQIITTRWCQIKDSTRMDLAGPAPCHTLHPLQLAAQVHRSHVIHLPIKWPRILCNWNFWTHVEYCRGGVVTVQYILSSGGGEDDNLGFLKKLSYSSPLLIRSFALHSFSYTRSTMVWKQMILLLTYSQKVNRRLTHYIKMPASFTSCHLIM